MFSAGGTLNLTVKDSPCVVIAAKTWKFARPTAASKIELDRTLTARHGQRGSSGFNGSDGQGEVGRQGDPGQTGGAGGSGEDGETVHRPHLYLISGDITSPDGDPLPGYLKLSIVGLGINGGDGGPGGTGGNGGQGARGKEGVDSVSGKLPSAIGNPPGFVVYMV